MDMLDTTGDGLPSLLTGFFLIFFPSRFPLPSAAVPSREINRTHTINRPSSYVFIIYMICFCTCSKASMISRPTGSRHASRASNRASLGGRGREAFKGARVDGLSWGGVWARGKGDRLGFRVWGEGYLVGGAGCLHYTLTSLKKTFTQGAVAAFRAWVEAGFFFFFACGGILFCV